MSATAILEIAGLDIAQGTHFELAIARLSLFAGDPVCLAGPSGCGKSSLLDTVAMMAPPRAVGRFALRLAPGAAPADLAADMTRQRIHRLAHHRAGPVGYAPQSGGMLPFLDAGSDAGSSIALAGIDPSGSEGRSLAARQARIAEGLGIAADLGKSRSALSGGQRKRVSLLRALARPRILLVLDEPTAALDDRIAAHAFGLIAAICRQDHSACLIASHDVAGAKQAGFRILRIDGVADGPMHRARILDTAA